MKNLPRAAMVAVAAALLGNESVQAQYQVNDLLLGFNRVDNSGSGPQPADYVINLGNFASAVGVGGSSIVDLSSLLNGSTFSALYGSLSSGVTMSVVGGNGASSGRDIFATSLRLGPGPGNVANSTAPGSIASTFMANGANNVAAMSGPSGLNLSAGMSMTIAQSDPNSYNTWILSTTPPSYFSGTGIDPRGSTSGLTLYEDLYRARNNVNGNNFDYLGFFTLDMNGAATLTFTPLAVPEPSPWAFLASGALMMLWLSRRSKTPSRPTSF